jgi:hypothetical protein
VGRKVLARDSRLKWLAILPAFLIECQKVKFFSLKKKELIFPGSSIGTVPPEAGLIPLLAGLIPVDRIDWVF